ncbi:uncharacterized protein N7482_006754 [Penicillium canariense]|uniref:Zn(2)-C6 fungal-type domain-containing protein n=1 Tax=Penicillium canariense TaxID=189055 RepID=A0A9W9HXX5_9EURO|nr:uncharacterized protein N7482_006754 [Penicillium canariense]KAJ5159750.1 hypothetical protein N7482_006754 [Penicillium canariense]
MSSSDHKPKIRPQQSCLKCRERKVRVCIDQSPHPPNSNIPIPARPSTSQKEMNTTKKTTQANRQCSRLQCDRSIPCEACIHRGIESECTYLTSAEDRAHISQAEIIDRLRREVTQLRGQLTQGPGARGPSPARRRERALYARKYKKSRGSAEPRASYAAGSASGTRSGSRSVTDSEPVDGGSWPGSSPSSTSTTTMTNPMAMTSPDSTGSESGASAGYAQHQAYPGSTAPYGTQIVKADVATITESAAFGNYPLGDAMAQCQVSGLPAFPGEIPGSCPMQGLSQAPQAHAPAPAPDGVIAGPPMHMYGSEESPSQDGVYSHSNHHLCEDYADMNTLNAHSPSQAYPLPWAQEHGHHLANAQPPAQAPAPPDSSYYYSSSSMDTFAQHDPTSHPQLHLSHTPCPLPQSHPLPPPSHPTEYQAHAINSIPDSWKGPDKQDLLETLLETISSCHEERIAQVVAVVRASETPEEAVSGICQVLGISADGAGPP